MNRERVQVEPSKTHEIGAPQWAYWENLVCSLMRQEMLSRNISYKELSRRLEKIGIFESPDQLNRKVNRKRFSAAFMLACLHAIGVRELDFSAEERNENSRKTHPSR